MSRSYKKTPCDWGNNRKKWIKNQANRRVRRNNKPIHDGADYRRLFDSWSIRDGMGYIIEEGYRASEVEHEAYWVMRRGEEPENVDSAMNYRQKRFRRK